MKIFSIDTCPCEQYECEWRYRSSCYGGIETLGIIKWRNGGTGLHVIEDEDTII